MIRALALALAFASVAALASPKRQQPQRHTADACEVPSIQEYYRKYYDVPASETGFVTFSKDLDGDGHPEVFLAAQSSCGSRGCDYLVFQQIGPRCWRSLLAVTGSLSITDRWSSGYRVVHVKRKTDATGISTEVDFAFDDIDQRYIEQRSTLQELQR